MSTTRKTKRNFSYFIGIDISRNKLDFGVRNQERTLFHKEIANEVTAIRSMVMELKTLEKFRMANALFCMEDSGIYLNHVLKVLHKLRAHVHIGNALHIKNSLGTIREKSDQQDALRLATYAYRYRDELRLWEPRRSELIQLAALLTVRNRMMTILGMVRAPLKDQREFFDLNLQKEIMVSCQKSLVAINADLNVLERSMLNVIRADAKLSRLFDIICSVPYVGPITAIQILISTNEFIDINCPRKFACYAGIAPFKQESGLMSGKGRGRISQIANRKMKTLLHICAVGTIRRKGEFLGYYQRRCAEGKPALTVVNAIRNKLVRRIFACVKHDRLYLDAAQLQQLRQGVVSTPAKMPGDQRRKRTRFAQRTLGAVLNSPAAIK